MITETISHVHVDVNLGIKSHGVFTIRRRCARNMDRGFGFEVADQNIDSWKHRHLLVSHHRRGIDANPSIIDRGKCEPK